VDAGADRLSIADTTGCMTPERMSTTVTRLRDVVDVPLHVHCHNDLGLAAANSLAAWQAGAAVIDVTIGGLGERTGIADAAQVATALRVAHGVDGGWDLAALPDLSRLVAERSGVPVHPQAPIVGANAFCHNAGLHVAAVFHDPSHYESIPAALVGRTRSVCVDRFAGLATLRYKARELGLDPDDDALAAALARIKDDERNALDDDAVRALFSPLVTV
jgi:isopropylmalate/homocitrate/citramalate synthase